MKTHGKLAALGAYGVAAGSVGLFALFVWISLPAPWAGMDSEHSMITMVSVAVIVAALIGAHIAMARQILGYLKSLE